MLALFRNYYIAPGIDRYVVFLSWLGVIAWLYFAFIQKEFMSKIFSGKTVLVDLVLGLPLVLMLGVIVYACVYWGCKLFIIFLLPQALILKEQINFPSQLREAQETEFQEKEHGKEEYWKISESEKIEKKENTKNRASTRDSDAPD